MVVPPFLNALFDLNVKVVSRMVGTAGSTHTKARPRSVARGRRTRRTTRAIVGATRRTYRRRLRTGCPTTSGSTARPHTAGARAKGASAANAQPAGDCTPRTPAGRPWRGARRMRAGHSAPKVAPDDGAGWAWPVRCRPRVRHRSPQRLGWWPLPPQHRVGLDESCVDVRA